MSQPQPCKLGYIDRNVRFEAVELTIVGDREGPILHMFGTIKDQTAPFLEATVLEAYRLDWRPPVLDMIGVDYLDSTGLRVLLDFLRLVRRDESRMSNADGVIIVPGPRISHLFSITGLDKVFEVVGTVEEARRLAHGGE